MRKDNHHDHHFDRQGRSHYDPWYSIKADYNTNAKSYYDYLARYNQFAHWTELLINRLLDRNIEVVDSNNIDLTKIGDWINNGNCTVDGRIDFDDVIEITAKVILSSDIDKYIFEGLEVTEYDVMNAIDDRDNGLWAADFTDVLRQITYEIGKIKEEIVKLWSEIESIKEDIYDIYLSIDALNGQYTILEKDKDYTVEFYNECYTYNNDFLVGVNVTKRTTMITLFGCAGLENPDGTFYAYGWKNDDLLANNMTFKHSQSTSDVPNSMILGIKFIGDYEYLNTAERVTATQTDNDVSNFKGNVEGERLSWGVAYDTEPNAEYDKTIVLSLESFNDGLNTDFSAYESTEIYTAYATNLTCTITYDNNAVIK